MKNKLVAAIVVALVTFAFVGCSKDDDNPQTGGSIDAAVGTYQGTIDIIGGDEVFSQELVVEKISDSRVRVTAKNTSLNLPAKELQVSNVGNMSVQASATEPEGAFIFTMENRALKFLSKRTAEGQLQYSFEGTKQ